MGTTIVLAKSDLARGRRGDRGMGEGSRRSTAWLTGSLLLFLVVPFTLIVIFPTNHKLLDATLDKSSPEAHRLLVRWGRLHEVRTVLGLGAFIVFVLASRRA